MRTYILLTLSLMLLLACKDNSEELREKDKRIIDLFNEVLYKDSIIRSYKKAKNSKYVYAEIILSESVPQVNVTNNTVYYTFKDQTYVSNIVHITNYGLDEEQELKDIVREHLCSLQMQGCNVQGNYIHVFKSYAEASLFREQKKYVKEVSIMNKWE